MDLSEQYDRLLRYCYMKVRDRSLAEDITQETFMRFFNNETYRDRGRESAYLYTIARNLCMDNFRKRRELSLDSLTPEKLDLTAMADSAVHVIDSISVEQALDRLDADEREIVVMRYVSGLSVSDISKVTGISRFSVRRRMNAALDRLRREMEG